MKHRPADVWPSGFTAEEVIEDMLINGDTYVGGDLGLCDPKNKELAYEYLTERGWIGPKGFLTKEGVAQAKRAQREWDERP